MPLPDLEPPKKEKSLWEKITSPKEKFTEEPKPKPAASAPAKSKSTIEVIKDRNDRMKKVLDEAGASNSNGGVDKGELGKKWDESFS
jgi:hypothetical protein